MPFWDPGYAQLCVTNKDPGGDKFVVKTKYLTKYPVHGKGEYVFSVLHLDGQVEARKVEAISVAENRVVLKSFE